MGVLHKARKFFLAGLVVEIEAAILLFFLSLIWSFFTLLGMKVIEKIIRVEIPLFSSIFSFMIMLAVTFLLGILISSGVGKKLTLWLEEKILVKIPFIGGTIFTAKKLTDEKTLVVLVEYPKEGVFQVGFTTHNWLTSSMAEMVTVFISSVPVITTGWTYILLKADTERLNISWKEVVEYNMAAGGNLSKEFTDEISRARDEIIRRREELKKERRGVKIIENFLRGREEEMHNSATAKVQ